MIFSFLLAISTQVYAMDLSSAMSQLSTAKTQGLVGEQPNGYLGVVSNKNNAQSIVNLINQARKEQYQKLAKNNKLTLQEIEMLAGKKTIKKTASGLFIKANGKWVKKP